MKKEYERKKKENNKKKKSVVVIEKYFKFFLYFESFWIKILEKREEEYMKDCLEKMPKECRELYRKFCKLKKDTKNLKENLSSIKKDNI